MKCLFCDENVGVFDKPAESYLIAMEHSVGKRETHVHVHGSLEDRKGLIKLVQAILAETGLEDIFVQQGV